MAPSVVGLQEIDFAAARSFDVNQLDTLALVGGYQTAYKSINWDKKYVPFPYWPPSNHFGRMLSGQAILSKYPVVSSETIVLSPNENSPAYYRAFYLDRLLQIATIKYKETEVVVLNVHLEAYDLATRMNQIEEVKTIYEKYASGGPVLLMGDFNSQIPKLSRKKDVIELLMKAPWITSAIHFTEEPIGRTFSSEDPSRMIDYIFYNENFLRCTHARIVTEAGQVSDHLPVLAEFEISERDRKDF